MKNLIFRVTTPEFTFEVYEINKPYLEIHLTIFGWFRKLYIADTRNRVVATPKKKDLK